MAPQSATYRVRSTLTGSRGLLAFLLSVRSLSATSLETALLEADARDWSEAGIQPDEIAIIDVYGRVLASRNYRRSGHWN
jgi:hypothetical protein